MSRHRVASTLQAEEISALHKLQSEQLRDPAQIVSQWPQANQVDPRLLEYKANKGWWETLSECGITLLVSREYEHLAIAMQVTENGKGRISYMPVPHPSGLAVDRVRYVLYLASTRNPNQIFDFAPVAGSKDRGDVAAWDGENELVPVRSRFYPGCLYIHDLTIIGGELFANAVGENAVVRLDEGGRASRVWWPKCIERDDGPVFNRNLIQLNSVAAGKNLGGSYFSASASRISRYRPGHLKFAVDGQGVIISGQTREPIAHGLTRPHSARLHRGEIWVDNSGYGEVGLIQDSRFQPIAKLPGWTRGLCFFENIAFVGTSRVIPRFRCYAPGLDVDSSICALHAIDTTTGSIRGSITWPWGNQIFAIDWLPREASSGFPWIVSRKRTTRIKNLFYSYKTE